MPRPRTPLGAHGAVKTTEVAKGKWRARTRYRFPNGKLQQVERFAPTKGKAQAVLLEALTTLEAPASAGGAITKQTTLAELGESFLRVKKEVGLAPSSLTTYGQNFKIVKDRIGDLTIGDVTVSRLQAVMGSIAEENGHGSAKGVRSVLSGMFALAIRNDVLSTNPVQGVEAIAPKKGHRGAKALPLNGVEAMIQALRKDDEWNRQDLVDMWEFMSLVGSRVGETSALRWSFVELDESKVTLGPSITRIKSQGLIIHEPAKTHESMRRIVVPARAIELLRHRQEVVQPTRQGLVFPSMLGKLRDPSNTLNRWRENRDRLGYPEFTTHGFRKTVATMLDDSGMSARDIAEYLGHKHPSMTQDVYMERNRQSDKMAAAIEARRPTAILFNDE